MVLLIKNRENMEVVMGSKKIFASVSSNRGSIRKNNQDNFYLNGKMLSSDKEEHFSASGYFGDGVFAVADGMGGESYGEFASRVAVETLNEFVDNKKLDTINVIQRYIDSANTKICDRILDTQERIGTTITLVSVYNDVASLYNVGDTRCFLYRNGEIKQISKDHTVVANLIQMNMLTEEEAKTDKRRHQLSQHLGIFPEDIAISVFEGEKITLAQEDMIIICSDGVTDVLDSYDIKEIIERNTRVQRISDDLVYSAINKGSRDNVTALVIQTCKKSSKLSSKIGLVLGCIGAGLLGVLTGLIYLNIMFWFEC